jgi:ribosomal protein S18 acetylase RimI-like enzyme
MGWELRTVVADDAEALAALTADIEADHPTNLQLGAAEVREILAEGPHHLEGAWDAGRLVGWCGYFWRAPHGAGQTLWCFADAHPGQEGSGLLEALVARAAGAARERHRADAPDQPLVLVTRVSSGRDAALDTWRSAGFARERFRFTMLASLAGTPPPGGLPGHLADDYELVTFDAADSELLREAHNAAFADYPNSTPTDPATWQGFMLDGSHVRHPLSFWCRSRADGAVASYVFTHEFAAPLSGRTDGREAYHPYLGTLPAHRGRGLAGALLRHALGALHEAGYARSSLEVDAENPTGALGLYEREGFVTISRFDELFARE